MLWKLQRKTIVPIQIIGYFLSLFIGVLIIFVVVQLFFDVKPLLQQQTEMLNSNAVIISKNVSVFKTANKRKIYFTEKEMDEIRKQDFVADVSYFNNAAFKIKASTTKTENVPAYYTDLFFESIPDKYLDVKSEEWKWNASDKFIPIIIPESYLNLYNFGFAESQSLPVISKNMIETIGFKIFVNGDNKSDVFSSKIVGFSSKINSILVPNDFMLWANQTYGTKKESTISRLLVEFSNPSDERILGFFNSKNYQIKEENLEFSKLVFFFKMAMAFVFVVALIIIVLSIFFVLMSVNLIIQKNKEQILNLNSIGYSPKQISKSYRILVGITSLLSIAFSIIIALFFRDLYLEKLSGYFDMEIAKSYIHFIGLGLIIFSLFFYHFAINHSIKRLLKL